MNETTARVGQIVEFVTNYPGAEGEIARGRVIDVGSRMFPCNPIVHMQFGEVSVLRSWWGNRVRVIG